METSEVLEVGNHRLHQMQRAMVTGKVAAFLAR